ncbi:site-specific integrase [Desulfoscipio geothermicus]|uniref:Phage integrase family protein n=1 Tax=Desulfoscipio geothermicus DSM 3669 TaxID=1121426 RepID=A0A1I6EAY1_9FIRM|nr:site-specific integrase [Desulfoscipio geothermicus]SFR14702.1 Phage integrase family protein [Desulfoscipio geothermicus DSM 3669]
MGSFLLFSSRIQEILIKPPKTESSIRKVTIDPHLTAMLKRHRIRQNEKRLKLGNKWKGNNNQVFTGPTGGLMVPSTVQNWWIKFREQNGLENVRLHDLRHTHATHLLASGKIDIKTIADRLGHKNAAMTLNVYSHVLPAKQREAALALAHLWE